MLTLVDVTELRQASERLERSLRREAEIVAHMSSGLFVCHITPAGELLLERGNPAAWRITGIDAEASTGRPFADLWPGPEGARLREALLAAHRRGEPFHDHAFAYADARRRGVYDIRAFRLPGERLAMLFEDVTERIESEARVRESERRASDLRRLLAEAESTARMGSWAWEVEGDIVIWSENLFRLFGLPPATTAPSFADHAKLYTAESMARLRRAVERALADGTPYELELTAIRADGTAMRCVARGRAERNAAGDVKRLYGTLQEAAG